MTVYCYDTEFLEDGSTVELISIGIVCEDGREFYAVNSDMDQQRIKGQAWLLNNVWPSLPTVRDHNDGFDSWLDLKHSAVMPKWMIANGVNAFLRANGDTELWAYYGAYDHVALAQLWGPMIDLPDGIPMWTHELMQLIEPLRGFQKPAQSADEHNALADARWNLELYRAAKAVAS